MLRVITQAEYEAAMAADNYYAGRWPYLRFAAEMAANVEAPPDRVLELGAYHLAIVPDCHTMDIRADLTPTFVHDARITPWPIAAGAYDLFIALQVFEHLGGPASGAQERAFAEIRRVLAPPSATSSGPSGGGTAILSFPYQWAREAGWHGGIDLDVITRWAGGRRPGWHAVVGDRTARIVCGWMGTDLIFRGEK